MKILGKLAAINSAHFTNSFYINNILRSKNLINHRIFSSKWSDNENKPKKIEPNTVQQETIIKISDKVQPLLVVPLNFFDQLYKLHIDSESIVKAARTLQAQSDSENIHLAAILPNETVKKTYETVCYKDQNEFESNGKTKEHEIKAFVVNKLNDPYNIGSQELVFLELNEDVRKQFEVLPISELNLEYTVKLPNIKEISQVYRKHLSKQLQETHKDFNKILIPLKFDAEIKGSIKLEKEKLQNILREMDSDKFNNLLSSLTTSLCSNAIKKNIEFYKPEINSSEITTEKLEGCIKMEATINKPRSVKSSSSIPEYDSKYYVEKIPTQLQEMMQNKQKRKNLKKDLIKNRVQNQITEEINTEDPDLYVLFNSKTDTSKHYQFKDLVSVGALSIGSCGGNKTSNANNNEKYPCGCPKVAEPKNICSAPSVPTCPKNESHKAEKSSACGGQKFSPNVELKTSQCVGQPSSPCGREKSSPDVGQKFSSCAGQNLSPEGKQKASSCGEQKSSPCAGQKNSPCGGEKTSPCVGQKSSPCAEQKSSQRDEQKSSPCEEQKPKPCSGQKSNPCGGEKSSPCGREKCAAEKSNSGGEQKSSSCGGQKSNPCGGEKSSSCGRQKSNPCAAQKTNPCGEEKSGPGGGKKFSPCGGTKLIIASGEQKSSPCGGQKSSSCGGEKPNPSGEQKSNPCGGQKSRFYGGQKSNDGGKSGACGGQKSAPYPTSKSKLLGTTKNPCGGEKPQKSSSCGGEKPSPCDSKEFKSSAEQKHCATSKTSSSEKAKSPCDVEKSPSSCAQKSNPCGKQKSKSLGAQKSSSCGSQKSETTKKTTLCSKPKSNEEKQSIKCAAKKSTSGVATKSSIPETAYSCGKQKSSPNVGQKPNLYESKKSSSFAPSRSSDRQKSNICRVTQPSKVK